MAIPRIGKGLQNLGGDCCNHVRHDLISFGAPTDDDAPDAQRSGSAVGRAADRPLQPLVRRPCAPGAVE